MPDVLPLLESLLGQMAADRADRGMLLGRVCESRAFPKFGEQVSRAGRKRIEDEIRARYENAVEAVRVAWGEPYFEGNAEECPDPWQPLGWDTACWDRGEFVACVCWGQEDSEFPFAVDVAVVRKDWDW